VSVLGSELSGMGNHWVRQLAGFASERDSVFSLSEAEALGIGRRQLVRATAAGTLVQLHADVFAFGGAMLGRRSLIRASGLQVPDGFVSHEAALCVQGVPRLSDALAVTIGRHEAGHTHPGIRIHRVRDLLPAHVTTVDGIPITTLERSIVDATTVLSIARLRYLLDQVTIERRMTTIGAIGRVLRQVNRRGRARIGNLAPLLAERGPAEPSPRSRLERRVDALLRKGVQLPAPASEHPLPTDGQYHGYVDRCWLDAKLILEIDGRSWHAREASMAKDRARDRAAARRGFQTLRILDEEIDDCPHEVIDDVRAAHAIRLEQIGRAA
jgi:Protein of unknown function (DUF559)